MDGLFIILRASWRATGQFGLIDLVNVWLNPPPTAVAEPEVVDAGRSISAKSSWPARKSTRHSRKFHRFTRLARLRSFTNARSVARTIDLECSLATAETRAGSQGEFVDNSVKIDDR